MRWEGGRESDNVEDARDGGGGFTVGGGGRGVGVGGVLLAVVVGWYFGINPMTLLGLFDGSGAPETVQQPSPAKRPPSGDTLARFVSVVLADTEAVWHEQFRQLGRRYEEPKLRLFRGSEPTACGRGEAAMGPFYCPGDHKVYIDLSFYETLRTRLGAPGDFAQAYVIAHEVGHHVQNLLGTSAKVEAMRGRVSPARQNALSVRLELQADCYAGLWAHHAQRQRELLEQGDIEEALHAAAQIGDDTLQRKARGSVQPESFTHGSSAQRVRWFKKGFESGRIEACNTFEAEPL